MRRRLAPVRALVALGILVAACGGGRSGPSPKLLARLPREGRVAIYETENDIMIAKNQRDQAALAMRKLSAEADTLGARWARSQARLKRAGRGDRVKPALAMYKTRRAFLGAQIQAASASVDYGDLEIAIARTRLGRTQVAQLVRFGLAAEAALAPYDANLASLDKKARRLEQRETALRERAQQSFERWKQAEEAFARATADYDTGIWLD